jgi:DNA-binding response OmpR family regulator
MHYCNWAQKISIYKLVMLKKILVVEDETSTLNFTRQALEMEDYVVEGLHNGRETFEKVDSFRPDLIIMDILLAGEDGRKICRSLKSKETTKHIPIIMMSSYPDAEPSVVESGANAFISKPYELKDFFSVIQAFIPS